MKKTQILFIIAAALLAASCNKKTKDLNYNGENPIVIALHDSIQPDIDSDYDVMLTSDNNKFVTILKSGMVYGKNVGEANINMDNGYNKLTIPVNVDLFIEPTFNFGCTADEIIKQHGEPDFRFGDSIIVYGNSNNDNMFVSFACTQMAFYLNNNYYYESDVYLKGDLEYLLNKYLEDRYVFDTIITNDDNEYFYYHNKADSRIMCGKVKNANQWDDFCLFYYSTNGHKKARFQIPRQTFSATSEF